MHLEYLFILERALLRAVPRIASKFAADVAPLVTARLSAVSDIEVACCPSHIGSSMMSNLPQVVAARLAPFSPAEHELTPIAIGELLISLFQEDARGISRHLELQVGGPGFLNATPEPEFVSAFLEHAQHTQANYLFTRSSLVFDEPDRGVYLPLTVRLRPLKELQAKRVLNADLGILEEYVHAKGGVCRDDLVMYLALLGNPEINSGPYIHCVGGSENVPWLLRRFLGDIRRVLPRSRELRSGEISAERFLKFLRSPTGGLATPIVNRLLLLRSVFHNSRKRRRPELFFEFVLSLIREWYSVFNRPDCRALLRSLHGKLASGDAEAFAALALLVETVVRTTYDNLEFSCDDVGFELSIE